MKFLTTKLHKVSWQKMPVASCVLAMLLMAASSARATFPMATIYSERYESQGNAFEPVSLDGAIEKIWIEYGVKVKGQSGIRIHTRFSVKNALNVACSIQATVERVDGSSMLLKSIGSVYKDGKKVLVLSTFTSPYDTATYPDSKLFVPSWALGLKESDPNKMKLIVMLVGEGKEFARSSMDFGFGLGKAR